MLNIGCHVSSAKGYLAMGKDIVSMGGQCICLFYQKLSINLGVIGYSISLQHRCYCYFIWSGAGSVYIHCFPMAFMPIYLTVSS